MILRRIDDFILDRIFQPIVNRFPDSGPTGVGRFFLTGSFVACVAAVGQVISKDPGMLFWIVVNIIALFLLYNMADKPKARMGLRNERRIRAGDVFCRLLSWINFPIFISFLCAPNLHDLPSSINGMLYFCYCYAIACDVMPPAVKRSAWKHIFAPIRAGV